MKATRGKHPSAELALIPAGDIVHCTHKMNRSATVSTSKSPPQLPSKTAWARGPPQNSVTTTTSSPQSPAPPTPVSVTNPANFHAAYSRRSSALGQGISISGSLNVPRSVVKQGISVCLSSALPELGSCPGSAVTFGSIDDVSAPISSSPASSPAVRPADGDKSFGSVAVHNGVSNAAKTAVINPLSPLSSAPSTSSPHPAPPSTSTTSPVPKFDKKSIAEPFHDPSTRSVLTPTMYYHRLQLVPGVPPYQFYPPQSSSHLVPPRHQPPPSHHSPGASPPSAPRPPPSVTSPPPTHSAPNRSSANVCAFIPEKKISIKHPSGPEVDLDTSKHVSPAVSPSVPPSLASVKKGKKKGRPIRIESQEQKEKRLAEERAREGASEEKSKISGTFAKANDDAAYRQIEEQELRKVEEPRLKEEVERAEKERKEAEERATREEIERKEAEGRAAREEEKRKEVEERAMREAHEVEEREKERLSLKEARAQREAEDLRTTISSNIAPALPSALATACYIEDINRITYPEGIKSPKIELNVNTQKGKFRYDRDFLLQFMNICKEKPDNLPPLDVIGLVPSDTSHAMSRGGSGRSRASNSMSMPGNVRSASIGLGFLPSSMGKSAGTGFQMGQFSTTASKMSSEERFLAASAVRSASVSGGPLGGRPPPKVRTINQGGTKIRDRIRTKRGANASNRATVVSNTGPTLLISNMGPPMELVAPLEVSANRWVAASTRRGSSGLDSESPEVVERKVKALLNKLTMERFDSISDQIIAWANKSEKEKDSPTLIQVIKLVFEKATDEEMFSEMYARLCRKMMERISPKAQDDGLNNLEGKSFAGGDLFRKYLLNRCQEDFERGWVAKDATATKATAGQTAKEASEKTKRSEEPELYSDEYYAAAKAKRRGLGLIRFIGELFKLQMMTERIMHKRVKKLLGNVGSPEEEEIESLCKLLTTVGGLLDTPKARAHLDVYFSRMRELTKNQNLKARMIFLLQDVIELRERKWVPRNIVVAPMTIAQVHEAAAKEQLALAGAGASRAQRKAGDLAQFGRRNKAAPLSILTRV